MSKQLSISNEKKIKKHIINQLINQLEFRFSNLDINNYFKNENVLEIDIKFSNLYFDTFSFDMENKSFTFQADDLGICCGGGLEFPKLELELDDVSTTKNY